MSNALGRRRFSAAAAASLMACRRAPSRPNILLILADDLSWAHTGATGDRLARTPHFDRLAREGALFTHSFSASPSCTPSRSSILTGRHQWQVEEAGVLYGTLPPRYPLYTHLLADAGYAAAFTGKGWAPGNATAGGLTRPPLGVEYNRRLYAEPVSAGFSRGDCAANFAEFLGKRAAGAPFCFWMGSREPHRAYEPGIGLRSGRKLTVVSIPPFWPDVDEIRSDVLDYYAEVEWFDRQIGGVLKVLEDAGELDRTLIVATSDNGMPFPRAKVNLYDWGVRMPLAIRWPERIQPGLVIDDFVSHIDLAPTFLDAAGVPAPAGITGRSLLGLTASGKSGRIDPARDCAFTSMERHTMCRPDGATYPMRAIRTRDYLYIRNFAPDRWPTGGPEFVSSNRTFHGDVDEAPSKTFMTSARGQSGYAREYDLCFGKRPGVELYDLAKDPFQVDNLAANPAVQEVKDRLARRLEAYLRQTGDPRIEGRDPWQAYVYHQTAGFGASFNRSLSEAVRRKARERASHKPE